MENPHWTVSLGIALSLIIAILTVISFSWNLASPNTGIIDALRHRLSNANLQVLDLETRNRDPIFSIPSAIALDAGQISSITYSDGHIHKLPDHICISPPISKRIDVRKDLAYAGPSWDEPLHLSRYWTSFIMKVRNSSKHPDSLLMLTSLNLEIVSYREIHIDDKQIVVLVNSNGGIGGGSGDREMPTYKVEALLSRQGAFLHGDCDDASDKSNLIHGKHFRLKPGDDIALDVMSYFNHSGEYSVRLILNYINDRGHSMVAKTRPAKTAVMVMTSEELVSRGIRFVDVCDRDRTLDS